MFSENTLAEIRLRLNIVDLIGEYVQLKKAGQGFQGLCPFHGEKTPSFHVHPLKQCFHCFGCHKGGNIFTFLSAIEGLNFPETVQRLAKRTGVTIEEVKGGWRPTKREPDASTKRLFAAHEWAAKYFHYLLTETKEHAYALDYIKSRGLTQKTIDRFNIGVSPKGWHTLLSQMVKRGFTLAELIQAGLVIEKQGSPTGGYDRFRQRLMFPILDLEGNVLGFGGRQLVAEENQPKYINSPESPLFSKRKVLYGLFENQRGIRLSGEAVIVEGYMDVVGLHESGVQNAIATMGTAMTEDHCHQLRGITRRVVTVFDPDKAGKDAWHRSVHFFLTSGIFAKDLTLPDGQDPDEFALKEGAEKFQALCEKAPRQITKLLKEIAARGPLSEEQSAKVLSDLTPILVASRRLPERATLWDDISLVLKISVPSLRALAEGGPQAPKAPEAPAKPQGRPEPVRRGNFVPTPKYPPLEFEFFQAALNHPLEFLEFPREQWKGVLKNEKLNGWLEKLAETGISGFEASLQELLLMESDPQLTALASQTLVGEAREGTLPFDAVSRRISKLKKEQEIKALTAQIKLAQRMGDAPEELRLLEMQRGLRAEP